MLLETVKDHYFYECSYLEESKQIKEIVSFLKNKKEDPLLKMCFGVYFDAHTFNDIEALKNVEKIFY